MRRKISGLIRLFRPELPAAAGICVVIGQVLAAGRFPSLRVGALGFLCGFALSGAALILNDLFDYEVDKINHPQRPLPSGAVTPADVIWLTVLTTLVGLAVAVALGAGVLLVSVIFWVIGFLYNWRYKEAGLPGNLMVSASVGVTYILGAMTVGDPWNRVVWIFALMAFFIDLGEEIAGDAMDMEGDKQRGTRSIALLRGKAFALRVAVALWGLVVVLSLVPILLGWSGGAYIAAALIIDASLAFFSVRLLESGDPQSGRRAMRGAYLGGTLGMVVYLIAQLLL
jgi:geranylgeranylglycerol-phosphate geranylgeranyltransferase